VLFFRGHSGDSHGIGSIDPVVCFAFFLPAQPG
jgi:hypothetical protein